MQYRIFRCTKQCPYQQNKKGWTKFSAGNSQTTWSRELQQIINGYVEYPFESDIPIIMEQDTSIEKIEEMMALKAWTSCIIS
jgi:hypothetical protein